MKFKRMSIEIESPEQMGYHNIRCNLTESSVFDQVVDLSKFNLNNLVLAYNDHRGNLKLREAIASMYNNVSANDVIVTNGAVSALYIVNVSLLDKGDDFFVQFPNYGTNYETPLALDANVKYLNLLFENGFRLSPTEIEMSIGEKAKLVSITNPHNPTGVCISQKELDAYIFACEKNNSFLLVDETYRDLNNSPLPLAATLSKNAISVSSLSKAFGLPGLRIGWIITKNEKLQELFLAAKEQIFICNSIIDEEVAWHFIYNKINLFSSIRQQVIENRKIVLNWLENEPMLEFIYPQGGVVVFPRIKNSIKVNVEKFYKELNNVYGTYVGPGHWFGLEKRYMRIGYGWPNKLELNNGLNAIANSLRTTIKD